MEHRTRVLGDLLDSDWMEWVLLLYYSVFRDIELSDNLGNRFTSLNITLYKRLYVIMVLGDNTVICTGIEVIVMSNVFQVIKEEWNDLQNVKIDLGMYGRTMLSFNNVRRILEDEDWCFIPLAKPLVEYLKTPV